MKNWWQLTEDEIDRLNPPPEIFVPGNDGNLYMLCSYHEGWLPVGNIPAPRTRFGWFMYHLIHGLVMRYPLWKVLGFAISNTKPGEDVDMNVEELD